MSPARSRNGHAYRPNPPRRFVGPPAWLASDHVADPGKMASDRFAGPDKPIQAVPSLWLRARAAVAACEHRAVPACGCSPAVCKRPDKTGPTDLVRCAACLGIDLPRSDH